VIHNVSNDDLDSREYEVDVEELKWSERKLHYSVMETIATHL